MPLTRFGLAVVFFGILQMVPVTVLAEAGLTYHGRLLRPDGLPVKSPNVQFRIQIRTPADTNCLMFEEIQAKDLSGSAGVFSLNINDGSAISLNTEPFSLAEVFRNHGTFTFPGGKCTTSNVVHFTETLGRQIQVSFNDGSFSGWEPLPPQAISFVPMALEALTVGGHKPSNFFRVETGGVPQVLPPWSAANY
ncbi:MAG TPA: hypothetical protein PL182_07745, partial [Pseudobdellovibrionaceae bacterium]|nr:hypothetical protein [Pseudobdellovibrionaceae bacterium]